MPIGSLVRPKAYFDSVVLMRVAAALSGRPGVRAASLVMGTPANKDVLAEAGLLDDQARAAGPNDLIIVVDAEQPALAEALAQAQAGLSAPEHTGQGDEFRAVVPRTLARAAAGANLALISTPGPYAAAEALKALRLGLNVFLFSDNVSVGDEVALKEEADRRGLLVMGPDCGTAVLGGVPLGFANQLRRGPVGLAGASGTGLQQVAALLDRWGSGISHIIGAGSRDLLPAVSGRTIRRALDALAGDPATEVIVLVSKPPAPDVAAAVLERAAVAGKPVVACLLGAELASPAPSVTIVPTLEDAARAAARLTGVAPPEPVESRRQTRVAAHLPPRRRFLRALYSGGTFAYEADVVLGPDLGPLAHHLGAPAPGQPVGFPAAHLVLDLGDDRFTVGRPHPMLDPGLRAEYLRAAMADQTAAVVILDIIIGFGAAAAPVAPLARVLGEAQRAPGPLVIAFVVGTEEDPQHRAAQEALLEEAGAVLAESSTAAVRLAARVLRARESGR